MYLCFDDNNDISSENESWVSFTKPTLSLQTCLLNVILNVHMCFIINIAALSPVQPVRNICFADTLNQLSWNSLLVEYHKHTMDTPLPQGENTKDKIIDMIAWGFCVVKKTSTDI